MKNIPNLLTLGNVVAGTMALYFISIQDGTGLATALIAAAIFDVLDGWAARKIGISGELGKQLDSLADAISFGATAGFLWSNIFNQIGHIDQPWAIALGAMVTAASVMRLARFNLDSSQKLDFKGMPTPANALFVLGIWAYFNKYEAWNWALNLEPAEHNFLLASLLVTWALSIWMLNSKVRVLSFKKNENKRRSVAQWSLTIIFFGLLPKFGALSISIVVFLLPILSQITLEKQKL
ncbi:MAG: hypothetical protein RL754_421 [Bacteroidota bacterium]|jgi:CDP-diacylglycerol--serine O-phosphatidyltransferase